MTNFRANRSAMKLFSSAVVAALILASCGSGEGEDTAETTAAPTETTQAELAETTTTPTTAETEAEGDANGTQVTAKNLTITVPDGWTSVVKGEDLEAKLAETNPTVLAGLQASGQFEQLRLSSSLVDWVGISPQGTTVNYVTVPLASLPVEAMVTNLQTQIEAQGSTFVGEQDYTGPLGSGKKATFEVPLPTGITAFAESRVTESGDDLIVATSDGLTAELASSLLDDIIDRTELAG